MVYLANPDLENKICPLRKVSKDEEIPFNFLEKIFLELEKSGLVKAKKGAKGGYFLAKNPKKIKVGEIIKVLEGTISPVFCVAKEKDKRFICPRREICLAKNLWLELQKSLTSTLNSISLADLIK